MNPKLARLSPLNIRSRQETLCAVPRTDAHKENPTLENTIFSPRATVFLSLHIVQVVLNEHPLAREAGPLNVKKNPDLQLPADTARSPSSASA